MVTASKPRFPEAEESTSNTEHLPGAARAARRATRQTGLLLPLWQQPPLLRGGLSRSRAGAEPPGCREPPAVAGANTRFIHTREWPFAAQNINSERLFPMRRSLTAASPFPSCECWELKQPGIVLQFTILFVSYKLCKMYWPPENFKIQLQLIHKLIFFY